MSTLRNFLAGGALAAATLFSVNAQASQLWVGYDTNGPVQRWTTAGAFIGPFGATAATGTALDGPAAWTIQPGANDSVITKYDAAQNPLAVIHFTSGIENGHGDPSWIEDMASGASHSLWLSGYNGEIYHIDTSGNVLTSWNGGHTFSGIEVVGNSVYTTGGFDNGDIYQYDLSGNLLNTISTPLTEIGGFAYDPSDNTFWAGDFNVLNHLSTSGSLLGSLSLPGNFHDGLAIGDLSGGVPEPATWAMMLIGFGGMGAVMRSRRRVTATTV